VADAVDIAALHVMRNAVDHGIEDPEARAAQGKAPAGLLRVRVREGAGVIGIEIEDDGRGIDLEAVRRRGIERGLLDPARAHAATDAELAELVFQPGLSTRTAITDLSGRGVGMDAVRSALARVGGAVRVGSRGGGCIVSIEVAAPARHLPVYQFLAPGGAVALAVSARWTPALEPTPRPDSIDPLHAIRLFGSSRQTAEHPPSPLRELGLRLRWGFLEVSLRAATEPRLVTGERICPTPEEHPIEVIAIDGREVLLLRPEHIADPAAAWPDRSATA
jgi:two-component system chemotaxis sensor kinase CheA